MTEDRIDLTIEDLAFGGDGLGRHEGMACFVPGVLPGEKVRARIVVRKERYLRAEPVEILSDASPRRVAPACPLALVPGAEVGKSCPGCVYQHLDYAAEIEAKQRQFGELLSRLGGADPAIRRDPIPCPSPLGYRNKITLHAGEKNAGILGYRGRDNRTVLDTPACPLAVTPINEAIAAARAGTTFLRKLKRNADIAFEYTAADGVVRWTGKRPPRRLLVEDTELGLFARPVGAFFQVNRLVRDRLYREVVAAFRERPTRRFLDLFCGVGVFAIAIAETGAAEEAVGVDIDVRGVQAAETAAADRGLKNVHFESGPAEALATSLIGPKGQDLTLLVDPPRNGLSPVLIQTLADTRPARLLYVSCAADTLARDLRRLRAIGLEPRSTQLIDLFPRTASFESVTVLE